MGICEANRSIETRHPGIRISNENVLSDLCERCESTCQQLASDPGHTMLRMNEDILKIDDSLAIADDPR